jgi:DNA-binding transcriptional LysR family regulator
MARSATARARRGRLDSYTNMDTLTSIKSFRQVVESGSFVTAAERLDMSTGMVSKHVKHVEQRLGVRLLNRNSRNLSLTEPGRVYFERCKTILDDLQTTELELGSLSRAARGTLRITAPSIAAGHRLAGLLAQYRRQYPEVVVDVSFEDRFVDLVEEGFDLALRIVSSPDRLPPDVIARPIQPATFYLAASREYVKRHGVPRSPEDLAQHDFVAVGNLNSLSLVGATGNVEVPLRVAMRYRSMAGVVNAITASVGIAPIPAMLFDDPPFKDVLIPILPEWPLREAMLYVVYMSRKFVPPKIRTFVDFMVESLSSVREPKPFPRPAAPNRVEDPERSRGASGAKDRPSVAPPSKAAVEPPAYAVG